MTEPRIMPYLLEYSNLNQYTVYSLLAVAFFALAKPCYWGSFLRKYVTPRNVLFLAIILTLVARVLWISFSSHEVKSAWQARDMVESDIINIQAADLTKGVWFVNPDGTPSGRRPIGYPLFLGLLYKIFGVHLPVVWVAQLVLALATTLLVYFLGKMAFSPRVGALSALFFSVYPVAVYSIKQPLDEHMFLALIYASLTFLIVELRTYRRKWSWLFYGLVFGYAAMTRTHAIVMPLVVGLGYLYGRMPWRRVLLVMISIFLVMQAINVPWVIRNYKAWKVPVLYTATGSYVYSQMNSTARGWGGGHIPVRGEEGFSEEVEKAMLSGNEGICHQACTKAATMWCVSHPLQCAVLGVEKILEFMGVNRRGVWPLWFQYSQGCYDITRPLGERAGKILEEAAYASYYFLFFAALFGAILTARKWKTLGFPSRSAILVISSFMLLYLSEHFFIYADRKYRYPLEPLMMIFACAFLSYLNANFDMNTAVSNIKKGLTKWKRTKPARA